DQFVEFYKERAINEIGLIIIGGCYIDKWGMGFPTMPGFSDDKFIDGLKRFTAAIHDNSNTKVAAQFYHSGRYSFEIVIGEQPVSASSTYSPFSKQTSRALEVHEIQQIIDSFTAAARRAKQAGFDAIELPGSAGYLIDQFLSPLTNKRTDEYGGSFENRLKFPVEVIRACKKVLGIDLPIILRYSGSDLVPGSNTLKDKVKIAPFLVEAGLDAINMTGGWHESRVAMITMNVPRGAFTYFSRELKRAVNIPVFASNRINDPILAESIIHQGKADATCIGRGLICDPAFASKAREGKIKQIRKCVACNQGCFDMLMPPKLSPVSCMRNPRAGMELKYKIEKTDNPRKIMVVGAGVAGLEFARIATMKGHEVSIHEKSNRIGGQAWLAATPPGREEIHEIIDWYKEEVERLGIELTLNQKIDEKLINDKDPDVVILATGSVPVKPPIPGIDLPMVHFGWDFLDPAKKITPGDKCVVIGGGATGIEVALCLSEFGSFSPEIARFLHYFEILDAEEAWKITGPQRDVIILEALGRLGSNFGKSTRWVMLQDLDKNGIKAIPNANIKEITKQGDGKATIWYVTGEEDREIKDIDDIFVATSIVSNKELEGMLKGKRKYYKIGDAKKPKDLMEAIHGGFKRAMKL
ncbi:MAG: FAD-dependent oxidoreductase, partial [Candidatus Hodarchaeota archaeon]